MYKERNEKILVYGISYKTSTGAKKLRIRFDKTDGFIKIHDKIRYLVIFVYSYCDKICKCKDGISDSISHDFAKTRIDSYDSLPIEKIPTLIIL